MNPERTRDSRPLRASAVALLLAVGVAACGGGSATGHVPGVPVPPACDSAASSSPDGFAIGMCVPTKTGVFLSVEGAVGIPQPVDSYDLTLAFPVALHPLDSVIAFTADNRTPSVYERDILGALQGSAYEEPLRSGLTAPYAALTDFGSACCYKVAAPWQPPQLKYAGYGTWEKVPNQVEGFVGPWYAATPNSLTSQWPLDRASGSFRGFAVGAVGPDEAGGGYLDRLRSFSAPIEIRVDGVGQIVSGHLGTIVMPYYTGTPGTLAFETLPLDPLDLSKSSGVSPGKLTGSLTSVDRIDPDLDGGAFEARYFGRPGEVGLELAGRLRFRTTSGLIAIGSFGARFVRAVP